MSDALTPNVSEGFARISRGYLRELRRNAHLVDGPNDIWTEYLLDMGWRDVLVVFNFRRYQRDFIASVEKAVQCSARLILVTDVRHSPVASQARHVMACPVTVPTTFDSDLVGLAMAEAMVAGMVERPGERGAGTHGRSLESIRNGEAGGNSATAALRTVTPRKSP